MRARLPSRRGECLIASALHACRSRLGGGRRRGLGGLRPTDRSSAGRQTAAPTEVPVTAAAATAATAAAAAKVAAAAAAAAAAIRGPVLSAPASLCRSLSEGPVPQPNRCTPPPPTAHAVAAIVTACCRVCNRRQTAPRLPAAVKQHHARLLAYAAQGAAREHGRAAVGAWWASDGAGASRPGLGGAAVRPGARCSRRRTRGRARA